MNLPPKGYTRNLVIIAYILFGSALAVVFFKFLFTPLLPFILAWISAMFIRPSINRIYNRTHLPKKVISIFCVTFVFALILTLLGIFFGRMIIELKQIFSSLMTDAPSIIEGIFGATEKIPFFSRFENAEVANQLQGALTTAIESALSSLCAKLPDAVMTFASSLPSILLFLITLILSTFYFGSDVGVFNAFIAKLIPEPSRHKLFDIKKRLMNAAVKYVRAYLIILMITFVQLWIGFLILDLPYSLTLAAVIAVIDILPVLGVGTVLVPWALILFIMNDSRTALGLLIIFGVIWLTRQIFEPKIVGKSLGIHPLITLGAMYSGYCIMGFGGLFLFPITAIIVKSIVSKDC